VQLIDGTPVDSATDLVGYLACEHLGQSRTCGRRRADDAAHARRSRARPDREARPAAASASLGAICSSSAISTIERPSARSASRKRRSPVIASPELIRVRCRTPRKMRLANALVRLVEVGEKTPAQLTKSSD